MEKKNQIEVGMKSRKMMLLSSEGEEDRLSSLPDAILIDILSLFPINSAVSTSVLSRRWRHLWTGINSFELVYPDDNNFGSLNVDGILSQLTSPIISKFILVSNGDVPDEAVRSCFRLVCSRNVQVIQVNLEKIKVPACVLHCQSLVSLELNTICDFSGDVLENADFELPNLKRLHLVSLRLCKLMLKLIRSSPLLEDLMLKFHNSGVNLLEIYAPNLKTLILECEYEDGEGDEYPEVTIDAPKLENLTISDGVSLLRFIDVLENADFELPNLKRLHLVSLHLCNLMLKLIRSSPLLEDLMLKFHYSGVNLLEIYAPNLKTLILECEYEDWEVDEYPEITIDAPKLENLTISDGVSLLRFINNPTKLVTACIFFDLPWQFHLEINPLEALHDRQIAKFLQGLSSVRNLRVGGDMMLFLYLNSALGGDMPIFHNLTSLETSLKTGSDGWKDLLLSLQCAPNLEDLEVKPYPSKNPKYPRVSSAPNKLKMVKIRGLRLRGNDDEVKFLEYFLKNAIILEQLHIELEVVHHQRENLKAHSEKEWKFCMDLFMFPRSSSTSKIVINGTYVIATSNAVKHGQIVTQF